MTSEAKKEEEEDFTPTRKKYYCKYYQSRPSLATVRDGYLCVGDCFWDVCSRREQCLAAATTAMNARKKKAIEVRGA